MRKILEDFYYGNLRPSDQQMTVNSKLQRAVDTVVQRTVDSITAQENFILGFRPGVRIMEECMNRNDGNIRIRGE